MIFFEKNKVLGVEPNRVLNILEVIILRPSASAILQEDLP
jgi:hypothetical protein